jgi:tetratricopeptide (TPR) repeat protein
VPALKIAQTPGNDPLLVGNAKGERRMANSDPEVRPKQTGLSFGELLAWHLLNGTRPRGSGDKGRAWGKKEFADKVRKSDRQLRNWLKNKNLPDEIESIEQQLFGNNQEHYREDRLELREVHRRAKFGAAPGDGTLSQEQTTAAPLPAANIPVRVPTHFMGRDDALAAIETAFCHQGRVAITTLHGLRGVGKTALAAAYAERHRTDYRAMWWIRAQAETTMRADLVGLGVRLGWVIHDQKEEPALVAVMEHLRHEGEGILLIYDNAPDADALATYLPRGGAARVLVTSNAHDWRVVAEPVEIRVWPREIGADYLIKRTGHVEERATAETLSEALGGLPLAHEMAAGYCEYLGVSLAEYYRRFEAATTKFLDYKDFAPTEYYEKRTVAGTFQLAIEEASKRHPAAEPLIVHAALLALEPIPLFLFAEAREKFGEPLASALAGDGLDDAVAVLRRFALIDRETIADEREPTIETDIVRLHRLVREVAAARRVGEAREGARCALIKSVAAVYPSAIFDDPATWPRVRRLDGLALALVSGDAAIPKGAEDEAIGLLSQLGSYRYEVLAAYAQVSPLYERALNISEKIYGPDHPDVVKCLGNFAALLGTMNRPTEAEPLFRRALAITERSFGPDDPELAHSLSNLAALLGDTNRPGEAEPLLRQALAIDEKTYGPNHPDVAADLHNLAKLLGNTNRLAEAERFVRRALAIREQVFGISHPAVAKSLNNLAHVLWATARLGEAERLFRRALKIGEQNYGRNHPEVALFLDNLATVLVEANRPTRAEPLLRRALKIREKSYGLDHPDVAASLNNLAGLLWAAEQYAEAEPIFRRSLAIREQSLSPNDPTVAESLRNLAALLWATNRLAEAEPLLRRALTIDLNNYSLDDPNVASDLDGLAELLRCMNQPDEAERLFRQALAIREQHLGSYDPSTALTLNNLASLLRSVKRLDEGEAFYQRALKILVEFMRVNRCGHLNFETVLANYSNLLKDQGHSDAYIAAELKTWREARNA